MSTDVQKPSARELPAGALAGRGIVITRPREQAHALADLVRSVGGRPILFPVIEIQDVDHRSCLNSVIDGLDTYDVAIFISPNAASRGMKAVKARRAFPRALAVMAIGGATSRVLHEQGVRAVVIPRARSDSEALLELPELHDVAGRRIVIFRGQGGRALLGETLTARGATVDYAECYRRVEPDADAGPLLAAWSQGVVHGAIVTSSEGLRNFQSLIGIEGQRHLAATPLFVPHVRIASTARDQGLSAIVVTEPGDDGLVRGLIDHFARRA